MQSLCWFGILLVIERMAFAAQDVKVCKDRLPQRRCQSLKHRCATDYKRMELYCQKTCNFCNGVCFDRHKTKCQFWAWHHVCKSHVTFMKKHCTRSCGFCGASAPPKRPECQFSQFGCCWDKFTKALGPNGLGCKPCSDKYRFCRRFFMFCIVGNSQDYLKENCPVTCRVCRPSQMKKPRPITSKNGPHLNRG